MRTTAKNAEKAESSALDTMEGKLRTAREEVAELCGVVNRTCGNLGIERGVRSLEMWNAGKEGEKRKMELAHGTLLREDATQGKAHGIHGNAD